MDMPGNLRECFALLRQRLSEREIQDLKDLNIDELWQAHAALKPKVRNLLLTDNPALEVHLDKSAFCGDPDVAGHIIAAFWDDLQ